MKKEEFAQFQAASGFTVFELAAILKVNPRQLFDKSKADVIRLDAAPMSRLRNMKRIVDIWNKHSNAPMRKVAMTGRADRMSLFECLCQDKMNVNAIMGDLPIHIGKTK